MAVVRFFSDQTKDVVVGLTLLFLNSREVFLMCLVEAWSNGEGATAASRSRRVKPRLQGVVFQGCR